jgi:hypothetical protein
MINNYQFIIWSDITWQEFNQSPCPDGSRHHSSLLFGSRKKWIAEGEIGVLYCSTKTNVD